MGYTATWAGYATGIMGILAVVMCPHWSAKPCQRVDARLIISLGILWLGAVMVWRMSFTPDVTFLQMALPTLLTGPAMVMFFVPVTGLAMASVNHDEQANAAGLSNYAHARGRLCDIPGTDGLGRMRSSSQPDGIGRSHAQWTEQPSDAMIAQRQHHTTQRWTCSPGWSKAKVLLLATLNMFADIAICFLFAAGIIWLAPKPKGPIDTSAAH